MQSKYAFFYHPMLGLASVQSHWQLHKAALAACEAFRREQEDSVWLWNTHSSSSPFLCLLRVNGETIGSPPEGWPVFAACVFVLHQMFTQNTPVPLRTRSAHPSNLPCRQRHCVPPGQHLTQSDPLATGEVAPAALSHDAAPRCSASVSCQTLSTLKLMETPRDRRLADVSC